MGIINDVIVTPLKIIGAEGGSVYHVLKSHESSYDKFGEAYFSTVDKNVIRPWKRHNRMTLNIAVIVGAIKFVMYDDRIGSETEGIFHEIVLSPMVNYSRLTVPPGIWMAFKGVSDSGEGILINIANLPHDPEEVDRLELKDLPYKWI